MRYKKIMALGMGVLMLGGLFVLSGCSTTPVINGREINTAQDVQALMAEAKAEGVKAGITEGLVKGVNSVDITVDNAEAIAKQADLDAKIIEDYKAELDALKLEQVETEAQAQIVVQKTENGYESSDLALNENVDTFTLDDSDISSLQDTKITFDGEKYNIHEDIIFSGNVGIRTSVFDEEFEENTYLTLEAGDSIKYQYVFDEDFNASLVKSSETLSINFLGNDIEITNIDATSFTVIEGETDVLEQGQTVTYTIDGEPVEIELTYVGDDDCKFRINGELTDLGIETNVVDASGYEIYIDEIMEEEAGEITADQVEFRFAKDVEITYDHEDEVIEDDDRWEYDIGMTDENLDYIGIIYVEDSDSLNDDYAPISLDGSYVLPEDFATISFGLTDVEYFTYDFEFTEHNNVPNTLRIDSSDSEGIEINGEEIDRLWILNDSTVVYDTENIDDVIGNLSDVRLVNDDTSVNLSFDDNELTIDGDIVLAINAVTFNHLGTNVEVAESDDIKYTSIFEGIDSYGTQDEDVVTDKGFVIESPENNADNNEFVLRIPSETVEATIRVE